MKNLKIKVIGIGGGGQQSVDYMYSNNKRENIDFLVINSDESCLKKSKTPNRYVLSGDYLNENGESLDCGGNPYAGMVYALKHMDNIKKIIGSPDVVFLTAGFGGGCGTGATLIIAEKLKSDRIKTIAIITKPFKWEGKLREQRTTKGIEEIKQHANAVITLDANEILIKNFSDGLTFKETFDLLNSKVAEAVYTEISKFY